MVFITTTLKSVMKYLKKKRAVSNLDEERRWTVHYSAPWLQQENVLQNGTQPTCVENLRGQAKVHLKPVLSECDQLNWDRFHSSWYRPPDSTLSTADLLHSTSQRDHVEDKKPTGSSTEEPPEFSPRPRTPLNGDSDDPIWTDWSQTLPLPTPEERMRQQAQTVPAHIVPINITGETFDRQASIRHSLVTTDTVGSRPKDRRRLVIPVPQDIPEEAVKTGQSDLPGHSASSCSVTSPTCHPQTSDSSCCSVSSPTCHPQTRDSSCQTEEESMDEAEERIAAPPLRGIRAQRAQGISAQLSNMSASWSGNISTSTEHSAEPHFHSLPRLSACHTSAIHCLEDLPAGMFRGQSQLAGNGRGCPNAPPSAPPIPNPLPPESQPTPPYPTDEALITPPPYHSPCQVGITRSESSQSDASSIVTADQWEYDGLPSSPLSSRCSSPVQPADSRSLCSMGSDGGSAPVGLRSLSYSSIASDPLKRSVYQCRQHRSYGDCSHGDRASLYSNRSLRRSISLRKAKKPPPPPARSDSLCRPPPTHRHAHHRLPALEEPCDADKSMCRQRPIPPQLATARMKQWSHMEQQALGDSSMQKALGESSMQQALGESSMQQALGESPMQQALGDSSMQQALGESPMQQALGDSSMQQALGDSSMQQALGDSSMQQALGESPMQQALGESSMQQTLGESPMQQALGESPMQQALGESPMQWGRMEEDSESSSSTPLGCSRESLLSELSTGVLEELQFPDLAIQEQELPPNLSSTEAARDADLHSSATGSVSPNEERNADVFEEMLEELLTPMPPCTTQELFVAIHRSKRKVLGRRKSEEEQVCGQPPSLPAAPTGPSLRSLRRCTSSCAGFKVLLLQKGSRAGSAPYVCCRDAPQLRPPVPARPIPACSGPTGPLAPHTAPCCPEEVQQPLLPHPSAQHPAEPDPRV
ncbi:hypothetical protein ANANG_G00001990 [Anguilla anguilla]|uniref:NHS-like protein 1 n=1 Tax=Anguilla anguilla TaxID=7936 RepID=A0A9D3MYZ4_ANGAN|nr:hypothetical protein ANANG_G00001990 [Anguilla anguilla]